MKKSFGLILATSVFAFSLAARSPAPESQRLPERLTDAEFWALVTDISEPGGYFRISDNFTSNEMEVGTVSTMLRAGKISGGAYIGVGPEQNFTYISAIRPAVAFIIDIRRQAVMQHLMFKALFELSKDRAEFISLTFSKPRAANADTIRNIQDIWNSFNSATTDTLLARRTYQRVLDQLTKTHGFKLTPEEIESLKWVWDAFTQYGPGINTQAAQGMGGGRGGRGANRGNFITLTAQSLDTTGVPQSFLSTDDNFKFVKSLHEKNLIIPVSGDFAGPKALRGIGAWLTKQNATVSAYYLSNVEQYLFQDNKQAAFYANTATLPLTATSVFIRPYSLRTPASGGFGGGGGTNFGAVRPLCPITAYLKAFNEGKASSNADAVACAGL